MVENIVVIFPINFQMKVLINQVLNGGADIIFIMYLMAGKEFIVVMI